MTDADPLAPNRPLRGLLLAAAAILIVAIGAAALLLAPQKPPLIDQARGRLAARDFTGAEQILRRAIDENPGDADARVMLASIFTARGNQEGTLRHLRRAVEADPDHPVALNNLGGLLVAMEQWEEALGILEHCVEITQDRPEHASVHAMTWISLANARERTGDLEGADEAHQRALDLNEGNLFAYHSVGAYALRRERWSVGIRIYEHLTEREPNNAVYLNNLVVALRGAGRHGEAAAVLARLREIDPNAAVGDPRMNEALRLYRAGEREQAQALCEEILADDPDNEDAQNLLRVVRPAVIVVQ